MRSSVDFPQPDGPSRQMKSLSPTASDVGSRARVGARPRNPGNVRLTASMASAGMTSGEAPGEQPLVHQLEEVVGDQADHADHHDAEDDLAGVEQRLAVGD